MAKLEAFLGIDQGSSSSKGVLLDLMGNTLISHSISVGTPLNQGEKVRQDPKELLASLQSIVEFIIQKAKADDLSVKAIGLACQRSGVCAWERTTLEPASMLYTWRDRSAKAIIDGLGAKSEIIAQRTSLPVIPDYAGAKISLLQKEFAAARYQVGTLDSFLLAHLLDAKGQLLTDDSMAARTLLYDLDKGAWDEKLCAFFSVDNARLATVRPSSGSFGTLSAVPFCASVGDAQAALIGRMQNEKSIVLNLGTISSLCVPTAKTLVRKKGFVSSVLYSSESTATKTREFLIEGIINASGRVISVITEKRAWAKNLAEIDKLCKNGTSGAAACAFFPIGGTATPDWKYDLPCVVENWDKTNTATIVRALIENVACFVARVLLLAKQEKLIMNEPLMVCGGLSEIDYLLQFISDVSGVSLLRYDSKESSARGAAILAIKGSGALCDMAQFNKEEVSSTFSPKASAAKEAYERWCSLYARVSRAEFGAENVFQFT